MLETFKIAAFLCSFYNIYPNGDTWNLEECETRAKEFQIAADQYKHVNVYELIALSIHECDLKANIHLKYKNKRGRLTSIDLCPIGLRVKKVHGYKKLSRQVIINRGAKLLAEYKRYHHKDRHKLHRHTIYGHYNWGYRILTGSIYDEKVAVIYSALTRKRVWRVRDRRTMRIVGYIMKTHRAMRHD